MYSQKADTSVHAAAIRAIRARLSVLVVECVGQAQLQLRV